jgi:hypothetical protein
MRKVTPKKRTTLLVVGAVLAALGYATFATASADTTTASADNQYVFFRGGNNHVYEAFHDANGWHGGYDLCTKYHWGCASTSAPSVAVNPTNNDQYVFFLGSNGDIYEAFTQSGGWHGPINMCTSHHWGCGLSSDPDVGVGDDGTQYVFYRGGNNHVYQAFHNSNGWHGGFDLCSRFGWTCSLLSPPRVGVNPSNNYKYVVYLGSNGDIYEAFNTSSDALRDWHNPINMCTSHHWGCGLSSAPDVGVGDDGTQYVFFRGGNNHVYQAFRNSNGWHGGFDLCSRFGWTCSVLSPPRVGVNPSNNYKYVFFLGSNGDIYEAFNTSSDALLDWHGPINMCTSHHWGCGVSSEPDIAMSP